MGTMRASSALSFAAAVCVGLLVPWVQPWRGPTSAIRPLTAASGPHVVINEVAWGGTAASSADEWIELTSTSNTPISLDGWRIVAVDGSPDIALSGEIAPYDYYLIERTDDQTVSSVAADLVASFGTGLSNEGETLLLLDAAGGLVDSVNSVGGPWPTEDGDSPDFCAMERLSPVAPDESANWVSHGSLNAAALDADGNPLCGSPSIINSAFRPLWDSVSDLVVEKTGPQQLDVGETGSYRIQVENYGGLAAAGIRIADALPMDLEFISQQSSLPFTKVGQDLSWSLSTLAPGDRMAMTVTVRLSLTASPGLAVTNGVTASTASVDLCPWNDLATWSTVIGTGDEPEASLLISGVLFDGYQYNDNDEAIEITNVGASSADLSEWEICREDDGELTCRALPNLVIPPRAASWIAKDGPAFAASFGFPPAATSAEWLRLANTGGEVLLRSSEGHIVDAVIYGDGSVAAPDWTGPPLTRYTSDSLRGTTGQILGRALDENSGLPVSDTNSAIDWLQYPEDGLARRRVRYPGWDADPFQRPLSVTETATLTLGVAPDNAFEVVAETLSRAQVSILVETYTFRHPELVDILAEKARQGVSVTLLLEGDPVGLGEATQEWREELLACQVIELEGGTCWFMIHEPNDYIYNRYEYLHAKMAIVDNRWLVLGSQNFSPSSLPSDPKANGTFGSRGVVMVIEAPAVIARARDVVGHDLDTAHKDILRWNTAYADRYGLPPQGTEFRAPLDAISYTVQYPSPKIVTGYAELELITAPDAALRRTDGLAGLLALAGPGDSVYAEQQYERLYWGLDSPAGLSPRLQDYANAARRGARVRVLLNSRSYIVGYTGPDEENLATVRYLNSLALAEHLDLRAAVGDPTGAGIHNKMVLVDMGLGSRYVHLGSLNGSETSNKVNREVALQVRSDAVYSTYADVFRSDWSRSNPIYMPVVARSYTPPPPPVTHLVITELCYSCAPMAEWIEIANPGPALVDLTGYKLGDAESPGAYEGMFRFPDGLVLHAGGVLVIAVNGIEVPESDLEFYESDPSVPNMLLYPEWGDPNYPLALRNEGDQVILLGPDDRVVDAVTWGDAVFPGTTGHPGVITVGASLERKPAFQDTDDCAVDFRERYPPTPGTLP